MYHMRFKGAHYEMGVKRGKVFERGGVTFPLQLDDFQLAHGAASEKILREHFPEVCEEIKGVADTIGAAYLPFASWMLCMGCCMYNLEKNIPVEVRGCTAFAFRLSGTAGAGSVGEDRVLYGRNNDLPPFLKKGSKSEIYSPKGGNRFHIATSSFINGEEGLNEQGLAVAMTFVMTELKKIRPGFNSCFIVRYLLEKAENTGEAIALLSKLPVASGCNILLVDKEGEMAVVECTPDQKRIREAEHFGADKILCTVNSFTSKEMRGFDDSKGEDYDSHRRYRTVLEGFAKQIRGAEDPVEAVKRLLRGEFGFLCQYDDAPDFETVWSSVFDLKSLAVCRAEGDPRRKRFVEDLRLCRMAETDGMGRLF